MKRAIVLAFAIAVLTSAPAHAAGSGATRAAGALADGYLKAFNAGAEPYADFLRKHWPASQKTSGQYLEEHAQVGGYDVVEVERSTDTELVEVVKARLADDYFRFALDVGTAPGQDIGRLSLEPVARPIDVEPPRRIAVAAIGPLVDQQVAAVGDFSGAVLIAKEGQVVYARAGGLADREREVANTLETRFRMASMGKMFTAVAVVQLAQAGRLDLDATVGTYLPDYPNAAFAHTVTLKQLLTHTGGAGDFMSQVWADNYKTLKTPADYIALFGGRAPEFIPGSRYAYANYGFVILGRIVEAVSGQGFEDYLRDHVFGPAGMSHSGLNGEPEGGVLATRYVKTSAGYNPPPAPFAGAATPAGGAYSTVGDMLAFANALIGHRLLDATHTELLLTGEVASESGRYALGFEDRSAEGRRDVGHDGGGPGENGCLRMLDGDRATVIVLSNVAPTWRADKLCAFIAARLDTR
jgi:D-alanyl-D-alanine carboxypeptidase